MEWLFSLLEDFDEGYVYAMEFWCTERPINSNWVKYKENAYPLLWQASFIADIAREKYESGQVDSDIEVYYMRKSQAERMKEEKAGKHTNSSYAEKHLKNVMAIEKSLWN